MADDENAGVQEANPEANSTAHDSPAEARTQADSNPSAKEQDHNWREMRSAMKELVEKNRQLEEALVHMRSPAKQEEPDDLDSLGDEDIITKKQLMNFGKKTYSKAKEDAYKEFYNKTAEERLETRYPDFRSVCSPDNIEKLKQRFPDLARSIASNSDTFSQGKAAYDLIVSLGLNDSTAAVNRDKMNANAQRPNMAAPTKAGPLDSAHLFESGQRPALTRSLKDQLRKEMEMAIRGS